MIPSRLTLFPFKSDAFCSFFISYLVPEDNPLYPAANWGKEPDSEFCIGDHPAGKPAFDNDIITLLCDLFLPRINHGIKSRIFLCEAPELCQSHIVFLSKLAKDFTCGD